ncbi:hypothetical protein JR316_0003432 [Psilocybe cubensis]|uniref:Uncharacterized protein n=2 Tax=Psilocybe cubensis TaxID=181762 RepID=A0ACB8H7Z1_PSICU|nr:hypothetical protein JR316_0003432 [Psilocybe cubensis]KAH9483954.1 hypothetical protein JR316_0003432 [Psilocybe cubensis]
MGVNLEASEMPKFATEMPKRWCIVNRHITGKTYEVFLLTTFGGARSFEELGIMARMFGMPMGGTQWFNDIPGLTTIPPIFGSEKTSFVFAIPVVHVIGPSSIPRTTRVPPSELDRLRKFSFAKSKVLVERQEEIRKMVRNWRDQKNYTRRYSPEQDQFKPVPRSLPMSLEDPEEMQEFTADSTAISSSRFKPSNITIPPRHDISWILRHMAKDSNASKYLIQQRPVKPQPMSLPKPYYAPLPISIPRIMRFIR